MASLSTLARWYAFEFLCLVILSFFVDVLFLEDFLITMVLGYLALPYFDLVITYAMQKRTRMLRYSPCGRHRVQVLTVMFSQILN